MNPQIADRPWPWPELMALLEKAKREGLWFHCNYQNLWFSPKELERDWANGHFRWGAQNWQLVNPAERRRELEQEVKSAVARLEDFERRLRL